MNRDEERRNGPAPLDASEQTRAQVAFDRLNAVLTGVASSMVERIHERCPYRAKDDRCTFAGGCINQRREARDGGERMIWCGGDHQLRRTRE